MENGNNGFVLSEELTALREQVKRIIRDEYWQKAGRRL